MTGSVKRPGFDDVSLLCVKFVLVCKTFGVERSLHGAIQAPSSHLLCIRLVHFPVSKHVNYAENPLKQPTMEDLHSRMT